MLCLKGNREKKEQGKEVNYKWNRGLGGVVMAENRRDTFFLDFEGFRWSEEVKGTFFLLFSA